MRSLLAGLGSAVLLLLSGCGERDPVSSPTGQSSAAAPRLTVSPDAAGGYPGRTRPGGLGRNRPPIAVAASNSPVTAGTDVVLAAGASRDPEGTSLSFAWSLLAGPPGVRVAERSGPVVVLAGLQAGTYAFRVIVTDQASLSDTAAAVVRVLAPVNHAPVASAGLDLTVQIGREVQLDGRGSFDPDGDPLRYRWAVPPGVTLRYGTRSVVLAFAPQEPGEFRFGLTVNDGQLDSVPDDVLVTVVPATPSGELVVVEGGSLADLGNGAVTVGSFRIGRCEVTWGGWRSVRTWAASHGYDLDGVGDGCADDHPVHSVSWRDAVKWCNALSEQESRTPVYRVEGQVCRRGESDDALADGAADGYRLPTEAEWEYAARGGQRTHGFTYSGGDDVNTVAWWLDTASGAACPLDRGRGTWPVGRKPPNELGLHDMSGNVWEWCFDWRSGAARSVRVIRGGSWLSAPTNCWVWYRGGSAPSGRMITAGFRVAASAVPGVGGPAGM